MITQGGIKVYGVAGSGKTTLCMNILQELLGIDTRIDNNLKQKIKQAKITDLKKDEIIFTSFSKAAINSIKQKITQNTNLIFPKGRENPFKTLNQLTWQISGFDSGDILQDIERNKFFKSINVSIEAEDEKSEKDIILDFYSNLLDSKAKPLEEIDDKEIVEYYATHYIKKDYSIADKISMEFLINCTKRYNEWKKSINKKDYIDSIIYVLKNKINVNCRVLIVDEAQDLSYSQCQLIDLWIKGYDKEFLINFEGNNMYEHILQESYRLPKNISKMCN